MRTDWYKGVDPNLERLTELLSMSKPSHGYTIAETAPEIVTAPGVYFPARKGEVIPLESRQAGGNVNPTSGGMMNNTEDGKMKILASALKSIDKIVATFSPKESPMKLESRQEGGGVEQSFEDWLTEKSQPSTPERQAELIQNATMPTQPQDWKSELAETGTWSIGAPNPEGDIQAGKGLDALSNAMRASNLAILTPPPISLEQKEAKEALTASPIPGLPSVPTSSSYKVQPEAMKLGGSDLIGQEQNEKRKKRIPLFPAQEGAVTTPPDFLSEALTEEEKKRRLTEAMNVPQPTTVSTLSPGESSDEALAKWGITREILPSGGRRYTTPEGTMTASGIASPEEKQQISDRWKRERETEIQTLSDTMKYNEQVGKAQREQAEYDRYTADRELREAAGISPRSGMSEYEYGAKRMRMTPGEKYVEDVSKGRLAEEYFKSKGALDVAELKPRTPQAPVNVGGRGVFIPGLGFMKAPWGEKITSEPAIEDERRYGELIKKRELQGEKSLSREEKAEMIAFEKRKTFVGVASAEARGEAYGANRPLRVFDLQTYRPTYKSSRQMDKEPERFIELTEGSKALRQINLLEDIRGSIGLVRESISNPDVQFDEANRLKIYEAFDATDPKSALGNLVAGKFGKSLNTAQKHYMADLTNLGEQMMSMRQTLATGQGSQDMRQAIRATIPGKGTFDKEYANIQLDNANLLLDRLNRYIMNIPAKPGEERAGTTRRETQPTIPSGGVIVDSSKVKQGW